MLGSWQSSGRARHPTNSAKVKEVFQGPVKIWRDRKSVKQKKTEKGKREREVESKKKEKDKEAEKTRKQDSDR